MRFRNGAIFENLKAIGLTAHASRGNATLAGDVIQYTDENGSVFANTYDSLSRLIAVAITQATGVVVYSTTAQLFQYDGFSRLVFARDTVPPYPTNTDVSIYYDSLDRIVEEEQNYGGDVRYITHDAFTSLPVTDLTYPDGRQVNYGYDLLYRRNSVTEVSTSASIAAWKFFGNRTASVALGNGVTCSMMNNAGTRSAIQAGQPTPPWGDNTTDRLGYDGSGRLIGKRFLSISDTPSTIAFTTSYDPAGNKLYERALHAESRSALYPNYDSINRLLEYDRGVLATGGESITSPIALPGTDSQRTYDLDHLGNWKNTPYTPVGGSATTEVRRHNLVNEITKFATTPVLYDHGNNAASSNPLIAAQGNGNIADDGTRLYGYDALNRLTVVNRKGGDAVQVAAYAYDALGRRVQKLSSDGGIAGSIVNQTYRYLYDGQQIVEELRYYDGGMIPLRQFIWGTYIDELIQLNVPTTTSFPPLTAGTYYPLQDLLYRTTATTNGSGSIVEVYDYDAYGNTLMFNVAGTGGWFADNDTATLQPMCEFLFTGRQYDPEIEIYYYRMRYYEPLLGRFLSRNPKGIVDGIGLYEIVRSQPARAVDPSGLDILYNNDGTVRQWHVYDQLINQCNNDNLTNKNYGVALKSILDIIYLNAPIGKEGVPLFDWDANINNQTGNWKTKALTGLLPQYANISVDEVDLTKPTAQATTDAFKSVMADIRLANGGGNPQCLCDVIVWMGHQLNFSNLSSMRGHGAGLIPISCSSAATVNEGNDAHHFTGVSPWTLQNPTFIYTNQDDIDLIRHAVKAIEVLDLAIRWLVQHKVCPKVSVHFILGSNKPQLQVPTASLKNRPVTLR